MAVNGVEIEVGQAWVTKSGDVVRITRVLGGSAAGSDGSIRDANGLDYRNPTRNLERLWVSAFAEAHVGCIDPRKDRGKPWAEHPFAEVFAEVFGPNKTTQRAVYYPSSVNTTQVGGDHYKIQPIQPWDYIIANDIGFLAGNVIKYVTRFDKKNGVEDLKKARHYLDKLIESEQAK